MRLGERFGRDGPFLWVCYLAACKRHNPQGEFTYIGEQHGLMLMLGIPLFSDPLGFTLEEFFAYTGQLKQTRRTRSGDIVNVISTRWGEWQKDVKRQLDAARISRKRQESISDIVATNGRLMSDGNATDSDIDSDSDKTLLPGKPARRKDALWDTLSEELGSSPSTSSERGRWNAALKQLRDAGATPAELRSRCKVYRKRWPEVSLTPTAIAANWGSLDDIREMEPQERWKRHFEAKT